VKKKAILLTTLIFSFIILSCTKKENPEYVKEIKTWQESRETGLKIPYGWLSLVGLFWLKEGENIVGSDKSSAVVLPKRFPKKVGVFYLKKNKVTFKADKDIDILYKNRPLRSKIAVSSEEGIDYFLMEDLKFYLIKRSKGFGIRMKDPKAPTLTSFKKLDWHPIKEKYKVNALFIKHKESVTVKVPNILGDKSDWESPGVVEFKIDKKLFRLSALKSGSGLFFIFRDKTSDKGKGSYPSGRFYYYDGPIENNITLDFNKAYNPPCAYTPYATCPLPPLKNMIQAKIEAGEAYQGDH